MDVKQFQQIKLTKQAIVKSSSLMASHPIVSTVACVVMVAVLYGVFRWIRRRM